MKIIYYLLIVSLAVTGLSCSKDDEETCTNEVPSEVLAAVSQSQLAADVATIDSYLLANSITAVEDPTGLRYVVDKMGEGVDVPCLESRIEVTYDGRLMSNGDPFDASAEPVQFQLNNLILGWKIAFLQLPVGTSVTLYVPSGYAYGIDPIKDENGNTIIPANSNLIFDIELLALK